MSDKKDFKTYKGYMAGFYIDFEDNIIVGRVVNIRTPIAFHADKVSDLDQIFHDIIDDYLRTCARNGLEPEAPDTEYEYESFGSYKDKVILRKTAKNQSLKLTNEELVNAQPFLEAMTEAEEEEERIASNVNAKRLGSGFDDFLEENGLLEEVTLLAKEKLKKEKLA